jgi:glycosyltransferase involved in cell wall biosynthesis
MVTVSVVIPCYNQAHYLNDCLSTVIAQTFGDWECIIVNDGSNDNTESVAFSWVEKDPRIKYFHQSNAGLSEARNHGISMACGIYILPLDADDRINAHYLEGAMDAFAENSELKVVYSEAEYFEQKTGKWLLKDFDLKALALENMIFCTAFFKKDDWVRVGGYDPNLKYGWEDWEFWISILKDGGKVKKLPFVGFYYRIRENSMVRSLSTEQYTYLYNYITRKHFDFIFTQVGNPIQLYKEKLHYQSELNKIYNSKSFRSLQRLGKIFR